MKAVSFVQVQAGQKLLGKLHLALAIMSVAYQGKFFGLQLVTRVAICETVKAMLAAFLLVVHQAFWFIVCLFQADCFPLSIV